MTVVDTRIPISPAANATVENLLKAQFRPEFLNRLDEIVFYKPLTRENVFAILDILTEKLRARRKEQNVNLVLTPAAKKFIADNAYDAQYGARPLKRFIQSRVETLLARYIVGENPAPNTTLAVDEEYGDLVVKRV